jgi:succinylglutamic semialdehyde dehydrogenase
MKSSQIFINGCWRQGRGAEFQAVDPTTEEIKWSGRAASQEDAAEAVEAAAAAFEDWSETSLDERLKYLYRYRDILSNRKKEVREAICLDTGKPRWEAMTEVEAMIGKIDLSVGAYRERCGESHSAMGEAAAVARYKPIGALAVIGPFNLPGHLPNGQIVPALLVGDTVVFKPSEQTPVVGELLAELLEQAELPPGVFNLVQGMRETGAAVVSHDKINGVLFTGSVVTGKALHKAYAGQPAKMTVLEMGGNNPLVVHEISDYATAAYLTIQSAYITAGQRCTCARRLILPESAGRRRFIDALMSAISKIKVGTYTDDPEPFMGPVISLGIAEDLIRAQDSLASRGGRILAPMERLDRKGYFVSPGLMDVTAVSDRPDVELFGPFLQIVRVADFDEALKEANNTSYGLAAGLLSDNRDLYLKFVRKIRAGIINWNRQTTGASGRLPFGGIGDSGNFRPGGYYTVDHCSYPVASLEMDKLVPPDKPTPGLG